MRMPSQNMQMIRPKHMLPMNQKTFIWCLGEILLLKMPSSWTHEMDYDNDLLSAEVNGRQSGVETVAAGDKLPSNGMDTKANLVEIQEEKFLVEKKVQEFQLLERANLT